jgi:hypothetical protein
LFEHKKDDDNENFEEVLRFWIPLTIIVCSSLLFIWKNN